MVTNPTRSSYWEPGSTQVITWTSFGNITYVDIEFYKNYTLKFSINGAPNIGKYIWTINETIEVGFDWRIKISNSDNSSHYDMTASFTISTSHADPIPGYNIFIIISITCFLSMLYTKKRIKRRSSP